MHRSLRWLLILLIGELWLVLWVSAQDAKTTALPVKNETVASDKKAILRKLKQFLFKGPDNEYYYYDRDVRPNVFGQLNISAYYFLLAVDTVNEKEGYITTKSGLHLSWVDERLVWNKTDFDDIDYLVFSSYMIWTPTFLHSNIGVISTYADNVIINDDGHCSVMVILNEETPCFFDMTDFPKDTQTCSIHFFQTGQGTRFIAEGAAYLSDFGDNIIVDLAKSIQHRAWNVTDVSVHQKIGEAVDQPVDMLVTPSP
ncbi:hypothetical protein EB796_000327 [Bugula neritina]|uniref:Neurotransmitter-gated ion-channel ligand-binding domain-containing protein n=1 Tax=Bugula neritina TaxID=10212 RepID=A0A7J7KTD7_BUGNE|nr:hypothetical protein EB796_000327 [Bugula neritina]